MSNTTVSYEFVRTTLNGIDKFEKKAAMLGHLFATQSVREISRLHTHYPGHRTEYDYTKFGIFLYPNKKWAKPVLYHDGFAVDHHSGVIRGVCLTQSPAARDTVRLFKNSVLPKSLTLPPYLQKHALSWDVFGLERIAAIDNGMELIANAAILPFMSCGIILLRMPPKRGDFKGTVERTNDTVETEFVSRLPGYVPRNERGLNDKFKNMRARAEASATLTVEEYVELRLMYILQFNARNHPRLGIPRIEVWRNGLEQAPPILPTGAVHLKCLFALTYEVTLLREGVTIDKLKYNSPELAAAYRVYTGKVVVKLDSEDIRTVYVLVPNFDEPILATCTTFEFQHAMPQELWAVILKRIADQYPSAYEQGEISYVMPEVFNSLQEMIGPSTPGATARSDVQAVTQAAALPKARPSPKPALGIDLDAMLGGEEISDD